MCLVPKRNLTVLPSSSTPQEKIIFITSEQMVLSNFLRLELGMLSFFRVSSFILEMCCVLSSPLFQFGVLMHKVWCVLVNTLCVKGVNSLGISFKNKALGRDKE